MRPSCVAAGDTYSFEGPSVSVDVSGDLPAVRLTRAVFSSLENAPRGAVLSVQGPNPTGNVANPLGQYELAMHGAVGRVGHDPAAPPSSANTVWPAYTGLRIDSGPPQTKTVNMYVYDLSSVLSGSLDYVQLTSVRGHIRDRDWNIVPDIYFVGFSAAGNIVDAADMPGAGSASFVGKTAGVYASAAGALYLTGSDLTLSADFGTGSITGAATNFFAKDYNYPNPSASLSELLDFNFTGSITSGTPLFTATASSATGGLGLTGNITGAFFGPDDEAPEEVGLAYQLGAPGGGAFMAGAGVADKVP